MLRTVPSYACVQTASPRRAPAGVNGAGAAQSSPLHASEITRKKSAAQGTPFGLPLLLTPIRSEPTARLVRVRSRLLHQYQDTQFQTLDRSPAAVHIDNIRCAHID